jgi:hypothetical protein
MRYQRYEEGRGVNSCGLSFLPSGGHNCADLKPQQEQGFVPAIEIPSNLAGVAELAKPQVNDAHNVKHQTRRR